MLRGKSDIGHTVIATHIVPNAIISARAHLRFTYISSLTSQPIFRNPVTQPVFPISFMKHWIKAGSHPQNYEIGVSTLPDGKKCGLLKCTEPTSNIFGTLMQTFSATNYRSKRMLFSVLV